MPSQFVQDESVSGLDDKFRSFLYNYSPPDYEPALSASADGAQQPGVSFMSKQIRAMVEQQQHTLPLDYVCLQQFDEAMALMIKDHFERADGVMRVVLQDYVRAVLNEFLLEPHGTEKEFFIALYNLPDIEYLRDLRTEYIGQLKAFSGTVTRTTEVRPELFLGAFRCQQCGTTVSKVEQQCKFTQPLICPNTACNNKCDDIGLPECLRGFEMHATLAPCGCPHLFFPITICGSTLFRCWQMGLHLCRVVQHNVHDGHR